MIQLNKLETLKSIIDNSKNIVVLTGAGVSTESGIKDFRGKDGLSSKYDFPVETILSNDFFHSNPEQFFKFYRENFNCSKIKPNIIHKYLKKLEDKKKLKAIVTQNIDGLHSKAGNKKVYEIHGTTFKNHCIDCNKKYDSDIVFKSKGIPRCTCGGIIKPDVVLYGETLPLDVLNKAIEKISEADTLLVLGSSLVVFPAASLINYFEGENLVIINRDRTGFDFSATLVIHDNLKDVFEYLDNYDD